MQNHRTLFELQRLGALEFAVSAEIGFDRSDRFDVISHSEHHPDGDHGGKVVRHRTQENKRLNSTGYEPVIARCGCSDSCPCTGLLLKGTHLRLLSVHRAASKRWVPLQ